MTDTVPLGLWVDYVLGLDDHSFYIRGWVRDGEATLTRLTTVTPDGSRIELFDRLVNYPRPDADAHFEEPPGTFEGFSCFVRTPAPIRQEAGWSVELEDADGNTDLKDELSLTRDPELARKVVLDDLAREVQGVEVELLSRHTFPALRILDETHREIPEIDQIVQYGEPPVDPEVSLIVPIYRRLDHVELQLATFADDPDIAAADLIYVLDSPELATALLERSEELYAIYRLPFRLVTLKRHIGYSGANNAAASLSKGRLLLLLNSDVVPAGPGWLSALTEVYDVTPRVGALGPKLLYEDDSIQHAGMYFEELPGKRLWTNSHYFKGMHRTLPAANVARAVPAVTGACLMISRELYLEYDGLLGMYVQGDYEDSDLCLRLRRAGYDNWYVPEPELYHLEGQSYDLGTRIRNTRYNRWLHTELRGDAIIETMEEFGGSPSDVTGLG